MVIKLPFVTYLQVVPAFSGARQVLNISISKAIVIQVVEFHVQKYKIQWNIKEWQKSTQHLSQQYTYYQDQICSHKKKFILKKMTFKLSFKNFLKFVLMKKPLLSNLSAWF